MRKNTHLKNLRSNFIRIQKILLKMHTEARELNDRSKFIEILNAANYVNKIAYVIQRQANEFSDELSRGVYG